MSMSTFRSCRSHKRAGLVAGLLACAAAACAAGADDVVQATSADGRGLTTWSGEVLDYSGRELRLRLATGREKVIPAVRVVSVVTQQTADEQAGDEALAKADYRRAIERYRAALEGGRENRDWVRRHILAQIVWCQRALGQWEQACESFLLLLSRDPKTPYFDCIPLAWLPAEPAAGLEKKAGAWLAQEQPLAAVLLGASHLLSTGRRPTATDALQRLSLDRDLRIALLAQAQLWRTTAFSASDEQLVAWRRTLDKIPHALRAGPDFVVGSALAARHPEQAAILFAAVAVLYPRERQLAAAGLLRAGELLEKLERKPRGPDSVSRTLARLSRSAGGRRGAPPAGRRADRQRSAGRGRRVRLAGRTPDGRPAAARVVRTGRGLLPRPAGRCRDQRARPGGAGDRTGAHAGRSCFVAAARGARADMARRSANHRRVRAPARPESAGALGAHAGGPGCAGGRRIDAARGRGCQSRSRRPGAGARRPAHAIAEFKRLDEDLAVELRRRGRPAGAVPGQLSPAELASLVANVRYQLARAVRNQALSYPAGSPDRLNSLTQSLELVAPLAAAHDDDPLAWPARVDTLVCLRLAGRLDDAATRLAELGKLDSAEPLQRRLRAEGVRLLLAGGKPDAALKAAGAPGDQADAAGAELDYARLEAIVAAWQKAVAAGQPAADADWEKRAADAVRHIEALHGAYWTRRAEVLVAGRWPKQPKLKASTASSAWP